MNTSLKTERKTVSRKSTALIVAFALSGSAFAATLPTMTAAAASASTLSTTVSSSSSVKLSWTTASSPSKGWTYGRDGTDKDGYGAWSGKLSGSSRTASFNDLVAGRNYNVFVKNNDTGETLKAVVNTSQTSTTPGTTPGGGSTTTPTTSNIKFPANRTSASYTDAAGTKSTYHLMTSQVKGTAKGLVVYLDGDGMYGHDNLNSNWALGGSNGIVAQAGARGYATLSIRTPDSSSKTFWKNGAKNAAYVDSLINSVRKETGASTVWLVGYSGGSQLITQFLLPKFSADFTSGGAVITGGGGTPSGSSTYSAAAKKTFPLYWYTGSLDDGRNTDDGYNALRDAKAGSAYYAAQGFSTQRDEPAGLDHNALGTRFGTVLGAQIDKFASTTNPTTPTTPTTPTNPTTPTTPTTPAGAFGLTLTQPSSGSVKATWTATSNPAKGWSVGRDGTDKDGYGAWSTTVSGSTRTQSFNDLKAGSTYSVTVKNLDSGVSQVVKVTVGSSTTPTTPTTPTNPTNPTNPTTPTTPTNPSTSGWKVGQRSGLPFDLGVFAHDPARVQRFEAKVGRKVDVYQISPQRNEGFGEMLSETKRMANYVPAGAKIDLSVPLLSFDQAKQLGQALQSTGHGDAYVRPGWEFNLGGMGWSWTVDQIGYDAYKKGFRDSINGFRAGAPGIKAEWNPNAGTKGFAHATKAYPGDDVVDVVGVDVYNWTYEDSWNADGDLNDYLAFAKQHGKKMTLPEWGVHGGSDGKGDNADYIKQMLTWINKNKDTVVMASYFDENASYIKNSIADNQMPKSGAMFKQMLAGM